jgi:excisionase family DNA binding protein
MLADKKGRADMEKLAYSINGTARALSLGRTSIYAMIADGRLEAFKLGRRTLIKAESIRRLVDGQG